MAGVRQWYEDAAWVDLGHTVDRVDEITFRVLGVNVTSLYQPKRRVKLVGTPVQYGTVGSAVFDGNTTITLSDGAVPSSLTQVALSIINPVNTPIVGFRGAVLGKVANQSIPDSAWTTLTWTGQIAGGFTFTSNRVTVPASVSLVRVYARILWDTNATGERGLRIQKDGDVISLTEQGAGKGHLECSTGIIPVTQGAEFFAQAWQNSTTGLDVLGAAGSINANFSIEAVA
jgi:hypothetical protein